MKRTATLLAASAIAVLMLAGLAQAVEVTHRLSLANGETKTWDGTARIGLNANYNGLIDERVGECDVTEPGQYEYDPRTMCEYVLLTVTNPVPDSDADGKLKRNLTIILDNFSIPSPASDFDFRVYTTDEKGSFRGEEVGFSANTDVVDPDEMAVVAVETTRATPTLHYLVEVAYFYVANASYKGTVKF